MLAERRNLYETAAKAVYDEDGRTVSEILEDFPDWLAKKIQKV